jgi:plastocyanin
MTRTALIAVAATAALCAGGEAADHAVAQKGRVFSPAQIEIRTGDTVNFINDDTVAHNIYSDTPGNEFNAGAQPPGSSTAVTFTSSGEVRVGCHIHPRMQMTLQVTK